VVVSFGPPLRFAQPVSATGVRRKDLYETAGREMMAAIARLGEQASDAREESQALMQGVRQTGRA